MTRRNDIKKLIENHTRRLQKLNEQRALEGRSVDPKISLEIEDIESEIENLRKELAEIENGVEGFSQTNIAEATSVPQTAKQYQIALHWAKNGRKESLYGFDLSNCSLWGVDLES